MTAPSYLSAPDDMSTEDASTETSLSKGDGLDNTGDGPADRLWRTRPKAPVVAIFVHAGAGYHSLTNEKIHLEACSKAARLAMTFLKAGASAVDAVEVAIKCLEDREITNAGFGSNLSIDGTVECDATIVDYLGRSGACGAVPMIKNPISLARMILDRSNIPLSLRRVPPNILVGDGAKTYAFEHGMPLVPNEAMISRNALDRYRKWSSDLRQAEAEADSKAPTIPPRASHSSPVSPELQRSAQPPASAADYLKEANNSPKSGMRRDHTSAILNATWNEGQPDSPSPQRGPSTPPEDASVLMSGASPTHPSPLGPLGGISAVSGAGSPNYGSRSSSSLTGQSLPRTGSPVPKRARLDVGQDSTRSGWSSPHLTSLAPPMPTGPTMSEPNIRYPFYDLSPKMPARDKANSSKAEAPSNKRDSSGDGPDDGTDGGDNITDTVGAIAIDMLGHIAAGSSSGGIGMKHAGRIGPAALVGVGTAVLPTDPGDAEGTSVAAVTSGTGEHMATTMASRTCADRLYHGVRRAPGGAAGANGTGPTVPEWDEDAIMESFITDDFMGHPGVRAQCSAGAIGVMAVKKTRAGYYFYFAHNTDSFALSSMSSADRDPLVVMSRLGKGQTLTRGGRKIKVD